MASASPTQRFSDRVENYVRYRPGYPEQMLEFLRESAEWSPSSVIADLGSGTGISARYFLERGNTVFAVEPNDPMRRAAEAQLSSFQRFRSVAATAEATTLDPGSIDLVVAAQAFHWFDVDGFRREVRRILRPGGHAAIIWNVRRVDGTPFLRDYEAMLLAFGTDYEKVRHENVSEADLTRFFGGPFERGSFFNEQVFDYEGVKGRLLSSSYVPADGDPRQATMLEELRRIFDRHQQGGRARFEYDTVVYCGRVG
jgi:SAM-dependent methyltransferase